MSPAHANRWVGAHVCGAHRRAAGRELRAGDKPPCYGRYRWSVARRVFVLGEAGCWGGTLWALLGWVLAADGLAADVAVPLDGQQADHVRSADDADELLAGHHWDS